MTVLRGLNGKSVQETPPVSGGLMAVHNEPVPGFIRQARMGPDGVMLVSQGTTVLVPMDELWKLAETVEPSFRPPPAKRARRAGKGGRANA